jgi:APA family basic amino acid/polyamine antiporter
LNAAISPHDTNRCVERKIEVGLIAGEYIFGTTGGRIIGGFICLGLIASCSAMVWVGSRVSATMGEDIVALRFLSKRDGRGAPKIALLLSCSLFVILLTTATFEKVLVYIQFGLTLFSVLTVIGLIALRIREPNLPRPFRVPLYPSAGAGLPGGQRVDASPHCAGKIRRDVGRTGDDCRGFGDLLCVTEEIRC